VCISSILCAGIAAAEIFTRQDFLPDENSPIFFGGSIPRPNGPFQTNADLALVGAISFFFLLFLRAGLGPKLGSGRRMLHCIGLVAAIGMALMPMFRSVAIALLLVLIIDTFWERETTLRGHRVVFMLAFAGLIFLPKIFAPDIFEDRMSASNVYGRVAQFEQSLRVFVDHPLLGVGFWNFHEFVAGEPRYLASYEGVSSLDWPHNNLAQVLTETGILGFMSYVMAQVLLFIAMWRLRKLSNSGYLVWKCYIYVFLCYWTMGLDESTGYGPGNLWYLFVIAVFCKYVLTDPDLMQSTEVQVSDLAFSMPSQVF
jgi:O-antigen ligase